VKTSSPIPDWCSADQASWLIGAARDTLQKTEDEGDAPELLILVIQAHALLGVAAEKRHERAEHRGRPAPRSGEHRRRKGRA